MFAYRLIRESLAYAADTSKASYLAWGQFHECFTSSFYTHRSQKRQKDSQVKQLFALSGSACVKAARKHVDEIDPWPRRLRDQKIKLDEEASIITQEEGRDVRNDQTQGVHQIKRSNVHFVSRI